MDNPKRATGPTPTRGFAVELQGEWRIVRGHLHEIGRFTYYKTEKAVAYAETVNKPDNFVAVCLRWNVDKSGHADLEQVFRHRGAMYRLDSWYERPRNPASAGAKR